MEKDSQRLEKQMAFLMEADREKFITRQTYLTGGSRKENDAEHAWHIALMAMILEEYANEKIDLLHTIQMLLIHDLVEIYAGDTFAYDEEAKKSQRQREENAADRLFALLPEDQGKRLRALWEEFEAAATPEALFARTMDNIQPAMLNASSAAGNGRSWMEHQTRLSSILRRHQLTEKGSDTLWEFCRDTCLMPAVRAGKIIDDLPKNSEETGRSR